VKAIELDTPQGLSRVHLHAPDRPAASLILGHGAGGGIEAPDLMATTDVALSQGFSVALVEQPYRVAGRRSTPSAERLDEAWAAVVADLRDGELRGLPLVVGGRSAGARVACRTASASEAVGVLCLAFPLHPPGRPEKSRLSELDQVRLPTLVVQGERDQFGIPPPGPNRKLVKVPGNHGLKTDLDAVGEAVRDWLPSVIGRSAARAGG
jgi:uncharacterized protein